MSRKTEVKRSNEKPGAIVRDKSYYFNTLDLEHDLLKKASDIAERMMVAFMREHKVEVSINVDDIVNKIVDKIGDRLHLAGPIEFSKQKDKDKFSYNDGQVIIKTDKIEIKNSAVVTSKTQDSIKDTMDILQDLEI